MMPGPARSSGLRGGDVIVQADGEPVRSISQLRRIVAEHGSERSVDLVIVREKQQRNLTLKW